MLSMIRKNALESTLNNITNIKINVMVGFDSSIIFMNKSIKQEQDTVKILIFYLKTKW